MDPDGLLDTNTVILLPDLDQGARLPARPTISTITLAELSAGPLAAKSAADRARRQRQVQEAEQDFEPIPFDSAAARTFGRVAADMRSAGRKPGARAYDALIAAVAIEHGLPLFTVNPKDFEGIRDLDVVPVAHPGS